MAFRPWLGVFCGRESACWGRFSDAPPIMRKAACRIPQTEAARAVLAEQLGLAIPVASGSESGSEADAEAEPDPGLTHEIPMKELAHVLVVPSGL